MLSEIKKPDLNPLIVSKLMELDLNSPVHEISIETESTRLSLKMKDNTAAVFQLPLKRNTDPVELRTRIEAIADTVHNYPRRSKIIAEAMTSFLQNRGVSASFETKLAVPMLISNNGANGFYHESFANRIPEMPLSNSLLNNNPVTEDLSINKFSLSDMPNSKEARADYLDQRTIDLGGPKNLNRPRNRRLFGLF